MRPVRTWLFVPVAACLATLAACVGAPTPAAAPGPRLVSLSPPITETLFALGAGDQLVARSDWCGVPGAARDLPTAGSSLSPNLEALARLQPTLLLTERTQAGPVDRLRALAPTEELGWLTLPDVVASVRTLGRITGTEPAADALATRFETELSAAPDPASPRVLMLLGAEELARGTVWFVKTQSLHGLALHAAGYRNAIEEAVTGAPSLSAEQLVRLDPDAIVVLVAAPLEDEGRSATAAAFAGLTTLRAVQRDAVRVLDGPEVLATGPSILALPARLRAALHDVSTP